MVNIYFIILMSAEIFFYTFHISMIVLLFFKQNSTFKGPFYNIFRVVLIGDLLCFLSLMVNQKLPIIPGITDFYISLNATILPTIILNYAGFFVTLQFIGHTLMAFNRFTFIWFPLKYPTIWKRHWYTFLLFLLPFLRIFWQLQEFANYKFASDGSIFLEYISLEANKFFYGLSTMIYVITTCTAAVFNFLSFIKFYFYKQNHTPININEKSLLIVSFIVFLAQLWRTSYNVSRVLFPNNSEIILFYNIVLPVIYDIFALSGSLSLLALSKTTRKEYASFYLPKKFCKPHSINTVASSHPPSHPQLIVIKN